MHDVLAELEPDESLAVTDDGVILAAARPHAWTSSALALGGQYRLTSDGLRVEIELVEDASARRSVVYLDNRQLFLFIPKGSYRLRCRFLMPAGRYPGVLRMERLGITRRLGFYAAKAAQMLRRPPGAWLDAMRRLRRPTGIVGATLDTAPGQDEGETTWRRTPLPDVTPHNAPVSVIIPTKLRADLLKACIESLAMSPVEKDIIIIDNGSCKPEMLSYLQEIVRRPDVRVIRRDAPFNFSELCNIGARAAKHNWLLFLNDDIEALDGKWLSLMLGYAMLPDAGVVGARLVYPSRDLQHAGIAIHLVPGPGHPWRGLPELRWARHPVIEAAGEVDAVTAACLLIRRELFDAAGGFDEGFAVTINDVDLCLKVRERGLKVLYVPQATLLHKEGQSRGADHDPAQTARRDAELKRFYVRWHAWTHASPFWPPDMRRDSDTGALVSSFTPSPAPPA